MNTTTLLALAQNAVDLGNIQAACEFYDVALLQSPNDDTVMEAYAEILIHYVCNLNKARQLLRHAIDVNPESGFVKYLNLAQLSEAEVALELYTKALDLVQRERRTCRKRKQRVALDETASTVCCAMAELYLTDLCFAPNAEAQCELYITKAIEYRPQAVEPYQLQASLRLSQQRNDEALDALRRAVNFTHHLSEEHQPTYESKIELGRLLMQVSPKEAFAYLLEVLQLGDNNPYVWFLLGECARMRHRYADAARLLRRARVMNVVSDGDAEALREIDAAIAILVEEMGGPEMVTKLVQDIDATDPIALLQPEDEQEEESKDKVTKMGAERKAEVDNTNECDDNNKDSKTKPSKINTTTFDSCDVCEHVNSDDVDVDEELEDEPQWESCSDDNDDEENEEEQHKKEEQEQEQVL